MVQALDKYQNAALTEDGPAGPFQWLAGVNPTFAVILVTVVVVLGSEALTAALLASFTAKNRIQIGVAIAMIVPLVLAPGVGILFLALSRRLARAHQLIAEFAMTDTLTGIYNYRYFMLEAEKELSKANRYHLPLSVILFDVDRFKLLNDTYGHAACDDMLRVLSGTCKKCLRASDVLARYGGAEFVILLPLTSGVAARRLAERIRRAVEEMPIQFGSVRLPITVSLGVADFLPGTNSVEELLKEAELLLDSAKVNGRNRVEGGEKVS